MKKSMSPVGNLFLSSMLSWGVGTVSADEEVVKAPLDLPGYCHMQFPEMRGDTLALDGPVFEDAPSNVTTFFASCDHDSTGADAINGSASLDASRILR